MAGAFAGSRSSHSNTAMTWREQDVTRKFGIAREPPHTVFPAPLFSWLAHSFPQRDGLSGLNPRSEWSRAPQGQRPQVSVWRHRSAGSGGVVLCVGARRKKRRSSAFDASSDCKSHSSENKRPPRLSIGHRASTFRSHGKPAWRCSSRRAVLGGGAVSFLHQGHWGIVDQAGRWRRG